MRIPLTVLSLLLAGTLQAAEGTPEIRRPVATPQANGVLHTLRVIPEGCVRIQGQFTGNPAKAYDFAVVPTSARCQPRARVVDAAQAKPQHAAGWIYLDRVQVPSAACPAQSAVVRIWRRNATIAPPKLDAQGRSRLYVKDALDPGAASRAAGVAVYAVEMGVEGKPCR